MNHNVLFLSINYRIEFIYNRVSFTKLYSKINDILHSCTEYQGVTRVPQSAAL